MTNVRNILIGLLVSALLTGIIVSCGGGGGGYGGGGGGGGGYGGGMAGYTVGGTLSGATGNVVLKLNGGSDMTMPNGPFTFATTVDYLITYNVQVIDASDRCTVTNGAGRMGTANVTNVTVTCGVQGTQKVIRSALLNGAQAGTMATGTGAGGVVVDPTTKEITGGITFAGLTGVRTGAHIHRADGSIAIALVLAADNATATVPAGATPGTGPVLSAADYAELLAGTLYFNVHTAANPGGEIRGQINIQGGVTTGLAALDGAQEGNMSTAVGRGTIVFDSATRNILICYATHNVVNTNVAHIHTGAPGVSGPPDVVTLTQGANVYYAPTTPYPVTLTTLNVTDMNAGNTYFNVHSGTFPNGEIRGQIAVQ
jgi:hypothetical protein